MWADKAFPGEVHVIHLLISTKKNFSRKKTKVLLSSRSLKIKNTKKFMCSRVKIKMKESF
jgi:hypothetical protein